MDTANKKVNKKLIREYLAVKYFLINYENIFTAKKERVSWIQYCKKK